MPDDGSSYDEVARILDDEDESRYDEADELLDRARANGDTLFRVWRFRYALFRARLAARRGQRDEAAAFAYGALWQVAEDEEGPLLPRHPEVGRVNTDQETVQELWRYAESGDAERYDSVAEDYRSPSNGHVQWHWSLVERLRPNADLVRNRHEEVEAGRRAAEPLLMELRSAGFPAYDLGDFARQKLPSKKAAEILVKWLQRIDDPIARSNIATALSEPRARPVATQPLLDLFRDLPADAWEKDRVAAAVGTLARDEHFEQVAELVRGSRHGHYRAYLFWAISYMKDPRAVDLCLELLDDEDLAMSALRSLADLKSERARPVLERIANEPTTRGRSDEAQRQRDRVRIAESGLQKLDRAVAAGKVRP
jgi:HEAT repeat protein